MCRFPHEVLLHRFEGNVDEINYLQFKILPGFTTIRPNGELLCKRSIGKEMFWSSYDVYLLGTNLTLNMDILNLKVPTFSKVFFL